MTKEQVIRGCVALIRKIAEERGLTVEDKGTGHAFDGGFWDRIFTDDSMIPTEVAAGEGYSIELRPFWSSPEIDIRRGTVTGEEMLIFNYNDTVKNAVTGQYDHTGDFQVQQVRVEARWNYISCINEIYAMIEYVEAAGKEATE